MITLNIHLEDEKSEKAIKAELEALNVKYDEVEENRLLSLTMSSPAFAKLRKMYKLDA